MRGGFRPRGGVEYREQNGKLVTVEQELREQRADLIDALAALRVAGSPPEVSHEHTWQLREDGYTRSWSTTILDDGTIIATFGGSDDWSEDGDGRLYLQCSTCLETRQVPEGTEIDWQ